MNVCELRLGSREWASVGAKLISKGIKLQGEERIKSVRVVLEIAHFLLVLKNMKKVMEMKKTAMEISMLRACFWK